MADRSEALRQIQTLEFIIHDAALYLDTHPCDEAALAYFHRYKEVLDKAVAEYEACFGPLTALGVMSKNKWTWIEHPWPWQLEA
jgi:spore coat protein JB